MLEYKIEVCKDPMSGKQITEYCQENNAQFIYVYNVPNYPQGQHWHYFVIYPQLQELDTKPKPKKKTKKGGK